MGLRQFAKRGAFITLATSVFAVLAIAPPGAGPATASAAPYVHTAHNRLLRGMNTDVFGGGLPAATNYDLVAQYGRFGGSSSIVITTSDAGAFSAVFDMTIDVPFDVNAVAISVVDPADDSTVATTTVGVSPPEFLGDGCPGQAIGGWGAGNFTPSGTPAYGFPDGSYTLASDYVTFSHPTFDLHGDGAYFAVYGTTARKLPATFTVTATRQGPPSVSWSWTWQRKAVFVSSGPRTPWTLGVHGECFAPGETVAVSTHDRSTSAPHSVHADAAGHVAFATVIHPAPHPISASSVTLTGESSGQTATTETGAFAGSTLAAGQYLGRGSPNGSTLLAPHLGFQFLQHGCLPTIWQYRPDGSSSESWELPKGPQSEADCRLALRHDGELEVLAPNGRRLWSAHTDGTGDSNYLRVRDTGDLGLYGAHGSPVWTALTGPVRTLHAMGEGQILTRGQSLRTADTRLILRPSGNLAVVRGGVTRWTSHTAGRGVVRLRLAWSGNLRLETRRGHVIWSTRTLDGGNHSYVVVTANGDVQLRDEYSVDWHTRTGR